nr:DNA-directed RNA polymerase [Clostridioides difficile]
MSNFIVCSYCGEKMDKSRNKYITYSEKDSCKEINICTNCALDLLEKTNEKSKIKYAKSLTKQIG